MQYFILFLEGIITFISPCLLPMLPVYVLYFAGGETDPKKATVLKNALGFVLGFSSLFILMGAFAGSIGSLLKGHKTAVDLISGAVVVLFGLNYLGILRIAFLNKTIKAGHKVKQLGFYSSILFGIVFGAGWTPCVSAFLGSALMQASQQGSAVQGVLMLIIYSFGLSVPFVLSAVLIDQLKSAFGFIKRHYTVINTISGLLLVAVGLLMMSGLMGKLLSVLSF